MSVIRIGPEVEDRSHRETIEGINYILKASDPYGFWKITCLKTNKNLEGEYTTKTDAMRAATQHALSLNQNKKV